MTLFAAILPAQEPAKLAAAPAAGQTPQQKTIEAFLRNFYALGTDIQISVGTPTERTNSGILETLIEVKTPEGSEKVQIYLSKDGRYLMRGELYDLTTDPFADVLAKIKTDNAPILGNPNAPLPLVEYPDFECPVCRSLHDVLRGMLPNYPQVKVIFKDYPIESLHPWARTAALAGRCAYQQKPGAFWKMYDQIYDNQELISASNVWQKVNDFAAQDGLTPEVFKACLAGSQATAEVDANLANGNLLDVHSTPTMFVNGRRIVGGDPHTIQQYFDYEIARLKSAKPTPKP